MRIVIDILLVAGAFFAFAGVLGLIRMPDCFCRMQSSTNIATMGMIAAILGCFVYALAFLKNGGIAVKLIVLAVFIMVTNPISSHAIAKAAYRIGVRPEEDMVCDEYGRDMQDE